MKPTLSSAIASYRQFRIAKANNRAYRISRNVVIVLAAAFLLLLSFPQLLFAHETSYKNFKVYSRQPLDQNINAVLDKAEARLATSPLNTDEVKPRLLLVDSFRLYKGLSLYLGANSFAKGYALIPTNNIFFNKCDPSRDLVFRDAPSNSERSMSGVVAHEVTHLLIRNKFGLWRNATMPTWKKEGYAEYVAGGSTLSYDEGVTKWKASPADGTGYQYFKYYMLVKYLLEQEKISVDDLFNRDFDLSALEEKVLKSL